MIKLFVKKGFFYKSIIDIYLKVCYNMGKAKKQRESYMLFSELLKDFIEKSYPSVERKSKTKSYSVYEIAFDVGRVDLSETLPIFNDCLVEFQPNIVSNHLLMTKYTRDYIEEIVFTVLKSSHLKDVKTMFRDNYLTDEFDAKSQDGLEFLDEASQIVAYQLYILMFKENENNKER